MSQRAKLGSGTGIQPPRRLTGQEGKDHALQPPSSAQHPPRSPLLREKRNPPTVIDPREIDEHLSVRSLRCFIMGYLRLAVPSLRSIRPRTELTIARRTNAISEWAFRRRDVR